MFYCQNKGHICFLTKRDIYTLYKFTLAYINSLLYTNVHFFLHKVDINTFQITKRMTRKIVGQIKAYLNDSLM